MVSGEQGQALLATAILGRHPALGEGLDGVSVSEGCLRIVQGWLRLNGVADEKDAGIGIYEGDVDQATQTMERYLVLDLDRHEVFLKDAVYKAEAACRGLGWKALTMLEHIDGILSIVTPRYCEGLGQYTHWYGAESDKAFREELGSCGECPTDEEWEDFFKPSDFTGSFDDPLVLNPEKRPSIRRSVLLRVSKEHQDPWVRQFADLVLQLSRLDSDEAWADVRCESEYGSADPAEPMAVLWWDQKDQMHQVIDEWVQLQWDGGEALPHEFRWPIDTPENAAEAVDRYESGFKRLRLFKALARLMENQS